MTAKEIEALTDILCEFLEIAVHNILYVRKLYPEEIFEKRKKYGVVVYQSIHPQVNDYIKESLKAIHFHVKENMLKQVIVCINNGSGLVYERFIFHIRNLKNNFDNDPLYLKLERNMRDFCLKLHTTPSYLQTLPDIATFRIMLCTTEATTEAFVNEACFEDFPWIYVGDTEYNINAPDIVPVHTVDTDSLLLDCFIEKSCDVYKA